MCIVCNKAPGGVKYFRKEDGSIKTGRVVKTIEDLIAQEGGDETPVFKKYILEWVYIHSCPPVADVNKTSLRECVKIIASLLGDEFNVYLGISKLNEYRKEKDRKTAITPKEVLAEFPDIPANFKFLRDLERTLDFKTGTLHDPKKR